MAGLVGMNGIGFGIVLLGGAIIKSGTSKICCTNFIAAVGLKKMASACFTCSCFSGSVLGWKIITLFIFQGIFHRGRNSGVSYVLPTIDFFVFFYSSAWLCSIMIFLKKMLFNNSLLEY